MIHKQEINHVLCIQEFKYFRNLDEAFMTWDHFIHLLRPPTLHFSFDNDKNSDNNNSNKQVLTIMLLRLTHLKSFTDALKIFIMH